MNVRDELTEQDQRLLKKIEEIMANGSDERRESDSLHGFCAHLVSTMPQASNAFQQQLEARLVAKLRQQGAQAGETNPRRRSLASELRHVVLGLNPLATRHKWALTTVALCVVVAAALLAHPLARTWAQDVLVQFGTLVINVVPAQWETPQVTHAPAPDREPTRTPVAFSSPIQVVEKARDGTSQWPVPLEYVSTWTVHRAR